MSVTDLCVNMTIVFVTAFPVRYYGRTNTESVYACLCVPPGVHAAPVAGGELTRQCQMYGVRQELWQCAAAAGLALPVVQGHCK